MNFKDQYAAAIAANDTERIRNLDKMTVAMWDEAYVRACEIESPSSPDFDALQGSIYEELFA